MEYKKFTSTAFKHSYAYVEWSTKNTSAKEHKVFVCVHGLSRSSRDFDTIAQKIVAECEKRNESCKFNFELCKYAADMKELIEKLCEENKVPQIYYIGTSMGGLTSMFLFAMGVGKKINRLVINDIGAVLTKEAINRIADNVGANLKGLRFANLKEAENYFRRVSGAFGRLTDQQWANMAAYSTVQTEDGSYRLHFDPKIFDHFVRIEKDVELWELYNAVDVPTLLLHGVESDLLTNEIIERMEQQGPGAKKLLQVVHVQNCGHAPALIEDVQCDAIINFLFNA